MPAAVWRSVEGSPLVGLFPHESGSQPCVFYPYPRTKVQGTCTTGVDHTSHDIELVELTEAWNVAPRRQLSREWLFTVSTSHGLVKVQYILGLPGYLPN